MRYSDLRLFPTKFFGYYRMKIATFDNLIRIVGPAIYYADTTWRKASSIEERLSVTLRYLASGNSFNSLHYEYLLGATTIREIVQETCENMWLHLQAIYMPEPDENTWSDIAELFYKRSNFPNCLGAVDGKHVRCEKPDMAGSQYYNYKHYHSIVLMAIADANYSFIAVDVGGYGSSSDSGLFKSTNFAKKLERNQMNIPHAKPLPNDDNGKGMPFVFVGDEAFALSEHIMRPYPRRNLSVTQRVFNYRLTRARRFVECKFGILTNKWRILHRALDVNITFCDVIIKACCVLHNYVRKHDGFCFSDELYGTELRSSRATSMRSTRNSIQNRDYFAQYFTSTRGSVPWQYEKI